VGLFICGNNLTLYCLPANLKLKKMREAHNPEVAGSNPAPATMKTRLLAGFFVDLGQSHNPIGEVLSLIGVFCL